MKGSRRAGWRGAALARIALAAFVSAVIVPVALAEDAAPWLARAASAARQLNYTGTVVYQHGGLFETSRLIHLNDRGEELEKLVNLDGPAREVIRNRGEVRCFYPDAKIVRIEPRTFRNAFPSLSPHQQKSLSEYYEFRKAETGRVAGLDTQAWIFEPKDGMRYGHKFWVDVATGLILKGRIVDERNEGVEQFMFTDISIGAKVDREMVKPTWPMSPPDWRIRQLGPGEVEMTDTGWTVTRAPAGFIKIVEGFRRLRGERQVAHLIYTDGLVAVSVFIEPVGGAPHPIGLSTQGGINVYARQLDDSLVTVLGEAPAVTIRLIANSVARR